jgi:hypothetical protein
MDNETINFDMIGSLAEFLAAMFVLLVLQIVCFPLGIACFLIAGSLWGTFTGDHSGYGMLCAWLLFTAPFAWLLSLTVPRKVLPTSNASPTPDATTQAPEHPKVPYLP